MSFTHTSQLISFSEIIEFILKMTPNTLTHLLTDAQIFFITLEDAKRKLPTDLKTSTVLVIQYTLSIYLCSFSNQSPKYYFQPFPYKTYKLQVPRTSVQ
jgi:hypothetical protein